MLANISGVEGIVGLVASALGVVSTFSVVVRWLLHNAIAPVAEKVAEHDKAIARSVELGNSTNIKVARIEGFLSASGTKLPNVEPTLEKPDDNGRIITEPLIQPDTPTVL